MKKRAFSGCCALASILAACGVDTPSDVTGHGGAGGDRTAMEGGHGGGDGADGGRSGVLQRGRCGVDWFASEVVSVRYGEGQSHGRDAMPEVALGPPQGAGCCAGSLDVVSLGDGGEIVLGFGENMITDGPGVDFVVFENAFESGGTTFAELATVAVSADGERWHAFDCTASSSPYGTCAGHHPVQLDGAQGPFEPGGAGGDAFDLAAIGIDAARFVRITDRADLSTVFDLDAVGIVNGACL